MAKFISPKTLPGESGLYKFKKKIKEGYYTNYNLDKNINILKYKIFSKNEYKKCPIKKLKINIIYFIY